MIKNSGNNTNNFNQARVLVFYIIIAGILTFYLIRLFNLQILQGASYKQKADNNSTSTVSIPATRGIIYDRNGYILARNIASYNITITPALLPEDEGSIEKIYRELSDVIGVPVNNGEINEETVRLFTPCETDLGITQIVIIGNSNWPYNPVNIKCNVDEKTALIVKGHEKDWPGVAVDTTSIRDYPTGELTSEIIGFLGPIPATQEKALRAQGFLPGRDKIGYAGIESSMQDELAGKNGKSVVQIDVAGKEIRNLEEPQSPVPGNNIKLTIDTRLQLATKTTLKAEIDFWNKYLNTIRSQNGVAIAMNPKTGEILSLASYPTYENNRMARVIPGDYYEQLLADPYRPLFNHAISAEHPPGSVFKLSAAIGALNEGVITPEKQLECQGKIEVTQKYYENDPGRPREFWCYLHTGHGMLDFIHGVAQSCDVYFYKIGGGFGDEVPNGGLGIYRLGEYARALGYGAITGIELPGESKGLIPTPSWKRLNVGENWSSGDTYISTIGQGYVLATPLQVLQSLATLANDGKRMKPTLIEDILDSNGKVVKPFTPTLSADITKDPLITVYDDNIPTTQKKVVQPWVIEKTKEGMRLVVTEGTMKNEFNRMGLQYLQAAGKTGTAEYCDNIAQAKNLCQPGSWPTHAWFAGYAPYDNPEIAVVAFVYNGGEGATVAGPIVGEVLKAYFNLKALGNVSTSVQQ
jgi:penicillin-binding protein 2